MITRAIGLVIIVGDHETFIADKDNWGYVIQYISKNGGLFRGNIQLQNRITWP